MYVIFVCAMGFCSGSVFVLCILLLLYLYEAVVLYPCPALWGLVNISSPIIFLTPSARECSPGRTSL